MNNTVVENCGLSPARLTHINTLMQRYVDDGKLAGVIATVARRGQTVYLEKFGGIKLWKHASLATPA